MEQINLISYLRSNIGKRKAKRLRREGFVPGVIYGRKIKPVNIYIKKLDFQKLQKGSSLLNVIINLMVYPVRDQNIMGETFSNGVSKDGGSENYPVLIKEVQMHHLKDTILHIDFYNVVLEERLKTSVPVELVGDAIGVKDGGILELIRREIEIECLPKDIPKSIEVDISNLKIGHSLHISDLVAKEEVKVLFPQDEVIVTILAPKEKLEVKITEEKEPDVIKEKKEEKTEKEKKK